MTRPLAFWLSVFTVAYLSTSLASSVGRSSLKKHLLKDYDTKEKPTKDPLKSVTINASFALHGVANLRINEKEQTMESSGEFYMEWVDEFLQWDPEGFGGIKVITMSNTDIWFPRLQLMNSVEQVGMVGVDAETSVLVSHNGTVTWWPAFKWKTSCAIDITYFPLDTQVCNVSYWNPVQFMDGVSLESSFADIFIYANTSKNNAWQLVNSSVESEVLDEFDPAGDGKLFQLKRVWFSLVLKRKPTFLIWNVLVPSVMITLMSLLVFLLPCESGEKIGLSITVFLGYSVVLLMISDLVPQSGEKLPLLSQMIVASMMITAVSLCMTIFVLNIHHHNPKCPVPKWAEAIFLKRLAKVMRMGTADVKAVAPVENGNDGKTDIVKSIREEIALPGELLDFIMKKVAEAAESDKVTNHNKEQWEELARVIDRLFLLVSFLVILVTMSVFLADITS